MYERLQIYHQECGDADVPRKYDANPRLGRWVAQQRREHREGKLPDDKIALLEKLDFVWLVGENTPTGGARRENIDEWQRLLTKLSEYRVENGDCLVPREYEKDLELGRWVRQQRTRKALSKEQRAQLDALGFVWKVPHKKKAQVSFEEMLERLKTFKSRYNDCMVPAIYPDDLQLGTYATQSLLIMHCMARRSLITEPASSAASYRTLGAKNSARLQEERFDGSADFSDGFSRIYLEVFPWPSKDQLCLGSTKLFPIGRIPSEIQQRGPGATARRRHLVAQVGTRILGSPI
jgi:Helicase associated domain